MRVGGGPRDQGGASQLRALQQALGLALVLEVRPPRHGPRVEVEDVDADAVPHPIASLSAPPRSQNEPSAGTRNRRHTGGSTPRSVTLNWLSNGISLYDPARETIGAPTDAGPFLSPAPPVVRWNLASQSSHAPAGNFPAGCGKVPGPLALRAEGLARAIAPRRPGWRRPTFQSASADLCSSHPCRPSFAP